MRLTLVISSLQAGGAERVMTVMANYWVAGGREIKILTFDDGSTPPFYSVDEKVSHTPLGIAGDSANSIAGLMNTLKRVRILHHAIRESRPDAIISFMERTNVVTLLAARGLNIPTIISERCNPELNRVGKSWEQLRRLTYPLADLLVVQSKGVLEHFTPGMRTRACVIPNPVVPPRMNGAPDHSGSADKDALADDLAGGPNIIAMGRLSRQKGFDYLLPAFAHLKPRHKGWRLTILGEGPGRKELEALRRFLLLEDSAFLPGSVADPSVFLNRASLFVLPSRYEGFPNALCEAMACGLPVIAADCKYGPREILRHNVDGLLIPKEDGNALIAAMDQLMTSKAERDRLARRAPEVIERFALDRVMQMWEEAIDRARSKTARHCGG
jgi:GalNAc-alpha-(1->4)-GalNAc-alpha-(1->3)-diNAcBac-PP-undecaprenol alpha-1,4-N-acetyl-D-galactosaminyltransferase